SKVFEDLHVLLPALDDAIRVYFDDTVVAMRIAGLLRTFYLPKLLLMDRTARPRGLDQIKTACENYGYHRLLLSPKRADRRTVRLLRDNRDGQLLRSVELYSFLRSRRTAKIIYDVANKALWRGRYLIRRTRSMARTAVRLSKLAVRPGGPAKIWATVIRRNLEAGPNGYWLFMDRPDKAADNAEALYRYVRSAGLHDRIAFVMTDGAADWTRLSRDHFTLVPFNTLAQWRLLYNCEHFFTSHPDDPYIYPWRQFGGGRGNPRYKLDFLQHGIIRSDLSSWLGTKPFNTFCASSPIEYQGLLANPRYHLTPDILKLTGLARHDLLGGEPQNYILVFPTWRSFLRGAAPEQFLQSEFFISWRALLADQKLAHTLQERGLTLKLVLHSGLAEHAMHFPGSSAVDVLDFDGVDSFAELLSGARMLVTDYSSISFDMIYLRRPVVYFNFYESRAHSANAGARLDVYESLGERTTTVSQTVDAVLRMIDDEFVPAPEKLDAANGFFAFGVDGRNRKRIMDAVLRKDEQP
ncbi:MAG: CDP-glycerol glycerophosphotransferase family protein, partial [Micrococcales bacterium]|nr:CDP-glycerol glycerophosphotransferase family protein [Micrococcales bacterium]